MKLRSNASILAIIAATGTSYAETGVNQEKQEASRARRAIEEVLVTANKRVTTTQDVPVAVTALGENTLRDLDVDVFQDYLLQLPGVSSGGVGPGQNTIYIRGLASTTPNLTTAGVAGLAPNVALYLDEQPVTQVGRNLDVYAADLNRVEVLPGPQGTLFGASSQAGTIRLITNKAKLDEFEFKANSAVSFTRGGETNQSLEAVINYPVIEGKFALRGVFFTDDQGGYIDNVAGERTAAESARFLGAVNRPNGTVTTPGFQAGADLSDVTFLPADNLELVEDNFNDANYTGFRLAAGWNIDNNWRLDVSHMRQQIEAEGVFFIDPTLADEDDLSIQRFSSDELDDQFSNTAWTLEGRAGFLDIVYTGAFLDRETDQTVDYTDYLFVGQYLPYYICDASVSYPGDAAPSGTCQPPNLFVASETETQVQTHELRFNTPETLPLRATFGGFYSDQELTERNDFTYPGSRFAESFTPGVLGFAQNGALPGSSVSDPTLRPAGVIFFNDITRSDTQFGLFAEASYDLTETLTLTGGVRYHDVDVSLRGSANSSFGNFGGADVDNFGTNLDQQFDGTQVVNGVPVPEGAEAEGFVFKGNIAWQPNDNTLLYFTYSEGFRPGLPNRPAGAGDGAVPAIVRTDEVTNYEFGWKLDLANNQVRINGNAFFVDIQDLQTTIFDPTITNLFFSDNAANAEIYGVEADVSYAPASIPGLIFTGAFSLLETEITELVGASVAIAAPGEELSFAPAFQGNIRARYEWDIMNGDWTAHLQPALIYSDGSFSDIVLINRIRQDSYFLANITAGIRNDQWGLEVFVDNLTNERAQLTNNLVFDRERVSINRPLTAGLRVSFDF